MTQPKSDERFKMEVRISIVKEKWNGNQNKIGDEKEGYWQNSYNNERLDVSEVVNLGSLDFHQMTWVLVKLHNAVTDIKSENDE